MLALPEIIEEPNRLNALYNLQILDTPPEPNFDRLSLLAQQVLGVPCAGLVLFDYDRIFLKSCIGVPEPYHSQREMPLSLELITQLVNADGPVVDMELPDFAGFGPDIRFGAAPLATSEGLLLGALMVSNTQGRAWTQNEINILNLLAMQVMTEFELRRELIERQRSEAQLRSYTQELEMVNAELDAYGHTVAHDLKDPLNIILGFVAIMQMESDPESENALHLERIMSAGYTMTAMIEQLLHLAALRNAKAEMEFVDVNMLLHSVMGRLEQKVAATKTRLIMEGQLEPVMGHGPWIAEVFANLIANAVNYADNNKADHYVKVTSRRRGDMVLFEVEDNGIGIRQADLDRLFKAFSRLDAVKASRGTGLGLSIARRIVSRLGGEMGVESIYGEGSTFWFTLPAA
jgi:signal transduction histidine kinase